MQSLPTWPDLTIAEWKDTCKTLHRWTQIIGKIRTSLMPWTNHSWHTTLYVTPLGLTTLAMPCGSGSLQADFDFINHCLLLTTSDGASRRIELKPMSVAEFYSQVFDQLESVGVKLTIHSRPNEVEPAIPFAEDTENNAYDAEGVARFRQALTLTDRVMKQFRAGFRGKCSPVHFFWGSFDLAVTRFSGRTAPKHPGGFPNMPDWITREAYSHEVSSCGFWPGGGEQEAIFYSYTYPTHEKYSEQEVEPGAASYNTQLGEYVLPYQAIQNSSSPDQDLLAFFQSTFDAAADTGGWDRAALEWDGPQRF